MKKRLTQSMTLFMVVMLLFPAWAGSASDVSDYPTAGDVSAGDDLDGTNRWTLSGPEHDIAGGLAPHVYRILVNPANPSVVYAGTNQGVYRSADGGQSWTARNGGLGGYGDLVVSGLAMDPTTPTTLVIGTWGLGLLKTTDSGANWSRLADPLATKALTAGPALALGESTSVDGLTPPPVVAGGPSVEHPLGAVEKDGVLVMPVGASEAPEAPRTWQRTALRGVTINPSNRNDYYACLGDDEGLYRSTNGGGSWTQITNAGTGTAYDYVFAPSNNSIRYASFSNGLFKTTNGGTSWTPVGSGVLLYIAFSVAIHPFNPNIVLAATWGDGIWRTDNGGTSWTKVSGAVPDSLSTGSPLRPAIPTSPMPVEQAGSIGAPTPVRAGRTPTPPSRPTRYGGLVSTPRTRTRS